jgi:hypothetical protein
MRRVERVLAAGLVLAGSALLVPQRAFAQDSAAEEIIAPDSVALEIAGEDEVGDHHEGYYYPAPQTVEHYTSRVVTLPDSDKIRRQGFVIGMARQLVSGQYAPDYAIFAKGDEAQKLIITALHDGSLDTIYRARALFANMTQIARSTPFFQKNTQAEEATFFDLLKLLGFTQITITDGKDFCHQVIID